MKPASPSYSAFTVKHVGTVDQLFTKVFVSPAFDPASLTAPMPPELQCLALWDTGASKSVITTSTVAALGLAPIGVVNIRHAGGESPSYTYLVNIRLPNNVGIIGVTVSETHDALGFGAIIGMDIIGKGDFSITNVDGKTVMSFCIPSRQMIDYVVEVDRMMFSGTNRNAPCPCGSGKKFKHCHGR